MILLEVILSRHSQVLFTAGFLLKRIVISQNSSCVNDDLHPGFKKSLAHDIANGCWTDRRFRKAVIIIIDALRFDFVVRQDSVNKTEELPFQNKFSSIYEKLENSPENCFLYKFVADPPTTTLQRLKGMTTGSLPTFVDAGSNFAKTEITEDNFIDQLYRLGKNITFMGDDTWTGLFPQRFNKNFPYSSFNVKDLDTVDNGVIGHLLPELKETNWDLIIAHLLGVDHCGHTFGPYHSKMMEKLTQMDNLLRLVHIKNMELNRALSKIHKIRLWPDIAILEPDNTKYTSL